METGRLRQASHLKPTTRRAAGSVGARPVHHACRDDAWICKYRHALLPDRFKPAGRARADRTTLAVILRGRETASRTDIVLDTRPTQSIQIFQGLRKKGCVLGFRLLRQMEGSGRGLALFRSRLMQKGRVHLVALVDFVLNGLFEV